MKRLLLAALVASAVLAAPGWAATVQIRFDARYNEHPHEHEREPDPRWSKLRELKLDG